MIKTNCVPFPTIAETLKDRFSLSELSLRPFGHCPEDREVNFARPSRPYLEVEILECCTDDRQGAKPDSRFFWNLAVSKRIECLLTLATIEDSDVFMIPLRCLNLECQEGIEIDFSIEELRKLSSAETESTRLLIGDRSVRIRRPTGLDQLQWLQSSFSDERSLTQAMLETLVIEEDREQLDSKAIAQGDWIPAFNRIMDRLDPLVNFQVRVQCPYCNTQNSHSIDLGAWALQRLRQIQQQLFDLVHRLASHYHWHEAEILAIPAWRREFYLARIEREAR